MLHIYSYSACTHIKNMSCRVTNRQGTMELIPNGSSDFLTKSMRAMYEEYTDGASQAKKPRMRQEFVGRTSLPKEKKSWVVASVGDAPEAVAAVKKFVPRETATLSWWKQLGTMHPSQVGSSVKKITEPLQLKGHSLRNLLPLPETILGAGQRDQVVLVRLRSLVSGDINVCADQTLEFVLVGQEKHKLHVKNGNLLQLRVLEIYHGFSDYLHGITTGVTLQHSLASQHSYAICKVFKSPVLQAQVGLMDSIVNGDVVK